MKLFIIIATLMAYVYSAPTVELLYSSPVNPEVLVEVKPEEKITLITELAKFKRETTHPLYPTVLPEQCDHQISKAVHNSSHVKRDIPVPLVAKNYHPEESSSEKKSHNDGSEEISGNRTVKNPHQNNFTTEVFQKSQTLPFILKESVTETQQNKRDIPVPLVSKHNHPEESSKDYNGKDSLEDSKKVHSESHQMPVQEQKHNTKVGLATEISKEIKNFTQQQKRETSTSLVHKSESSDDKNPLEENEKVKGENHNIQQSSLSGNLKHTTTEELDKPQISSIHHNPLSQKDNLKHNIQTYTDNDRNFKENVVSTDIRNIRTLPTHQDDHIRYQGELNYNTKDVKQIINEHPLIQVPAEDLQESKTSQKPINSTPSTQGDNKPTIQDEHSRVHNVTSSTAEHPLIRQRPVPVAELFARAHDN